MNLVDALVKEVLSEPKEKYGWWFVKVRYNSWGSESETEVMVKTLEEAKLIKPGYIFQC